MEKGFHPISGEVVYMATAQEKEIIDVALINLLQNCSTCSMSGVSDE